MSENSRPRLIIVGNPEPCHVGSHLLAAALSLELGAEIMDVRRAYAGSRILARWNRWFRGRRPCRLQQFGAETLAACLRFRPESLLATGLAPLEKKVLEDIGKLGIKRLNYLTDDPWNPAHRAPWFLAALPCYDQVFSPRRANFEDLRRAGCQKVVHLPFAYAPEMHFPEQVPDEERRRLECDVVFVGGADADRIPYIAALAREGFRLALYGGYWHRYQIARPHARGLADPAVLRKAVAAAKVVLCLVRRANRDGHVMRSFETAATRGCMLVEDTAEHRALFGADGEAVVYFRDKDDMIASTRALLTDKTRRSRLADKALQRVIAGGNTYRDRLVSMLGLA